MIALHPALPLVRGLDGGAVALRPEWLRSALRTAAAKAGYQGWWPADDLVAGISLYLRYCYRQSVIELPALEGMVRSVLRDTGHREVADHLSALTPAQSVSLLLLVREASGGETHEFFQKLADAIRAMGQSGAGHVSFHDLCACVEELRAKALPSSQPEAVSLKQRIVDFVRSQLPACTPHQEVWCSIA